MLKLKRKVVHNGQPAVFTGSIPGPNNEKVVVVLRVKDRKHARVFRRALTTVGGVFRMVYRFMKTKTKTTYGIEAEVPTQAAYPYGGGSTATRLRVVP